MVNLKKMFDTREQMFSKQSEHIIQSMPKVIEAIQDFLQDKQQFSDIVVWDEINYFKSHDLVVLECSSTCNVGDVVNLPDGEQVLITEENAEDFKRLFKIGIPIDMVSTNSYDTVITFLEQTYNENDVHQDETEDGFEVLTKDASTPSNEPSFNMEELTDEQIKMIEMFNTSIGDKH